MRSFTIWNKSRVIKRVLSSAVFCLCFFAIGHFCHKQTKGFSLSKIRGNTTCIEGQVSEPMDEELKQACNQTFRYLARGSQSYVFVSEDGTLILKFFRNLNIRRLFWLQFPLLKQFNQERIAKNERKWHKFFHAYEIALQLYKEESGLIFFHPQKCSDCPTLTLIDPLGSPHRVNLSNYAFVIQKRAEKAFPYLLKCHENHEREKGKKALISIAHLIQQMKEKGLRDDDFCVKQNIGFLEGKAIHIDVGMLKQDPNQIWNPEKASRESKKLKEFIEQNTPEFLPYLQELEEKISHIIGDGRD